MDEAGPPIRTPDQRLRVFVSSTLKELAEERRAVRSAIESLRLATPVVQRLREAGAGDAFDWAVERGGAMPLAEVLALVREP